MAPLAESTVQHTPSFSKLRSALAVCWQVGTWRWASWQGHPRAQSVHEPPPKSNTKTQTGQRHNTMTPTTTPTAQRQRTKSTTTAPQQHNANNNANANATTLPAPGRQAPRTSRTRHTRARPQEPHGVKNHPGATPPPAQQQHQMEAPWTTQAPRHHQHPGTSSPPHQHLKLLLSPPLGLMVLGAVYLVVFSQSAAGYAINPDEINT